MRQTRTRESGNALILGISLSLVLFGAVTAVVMISSQNARALQNEADYKVASYLAEGGIAAAKAELASGEDSGNDGIGTVSVVTPIGDYLVTPTEVEPGVFQLDATGTASRGLTVDVQEVVELTPVTRFPVAALSIVGEAKKLKVKFKKDHDLVIDGGDTPAIAIGHDDTYELFLEDFGKAVEDRKLNAAVQLMGELSGGHQDLGSKDVRDYERMNLPIERAVTPNALTDLSPLYNDVVTGVATLASGATDQGVSFGGGTQTYNLGTADNPTLVRLDKKTELKDSDSITGHGTLIISEEFKMKEDSVLNWTGDVIIYGGKKKAKIEIKSQVNVNGNIIVIGEGSEDVEFKVKDGGDVLVVGSLFMATSNDEKKGKKAKLEVDDGSLDIDGLLFVQGGKKAEIKMKDDSDFSVNGMMQLSLGTEDETDEVKLEFEGSTEITKDEDALKKALLGFERFGSSLGVGMESVVGYGIQTRVWTKKNETGSNNGNAYGLDKVRNENSNNGNAFGLDGVTNGNSNNGNGALK